MKFPSFVLINKKKNSKKNKFSKSTFNKIFDNILFYIMILFMALSMMGVFLALQDTMQDVMAYLKGGSKYDKSTIVGIFGLGFTLATMMVLMRSMTENESERKELKLHFYNLCLIMVLSIIFVSIPHEHIYNYCGEIVYYSVIFVVLTLIFIKLLFVMIRLVPYLLVKSRFSITLPSLFDIHNKDSE